MCTHCCTILLNTRHARDARHKLTLGLPHSHFYSFREICSPQKRAPYGIIMMVLAVVTVNIQSFLQLAHNFTEAHSTYTYTHSCNTYSHATQGMCGPHLKTLCIHVTGGVRHGLESRTLLEILESRILYWQKNSVYFCISDIVFKSISITMKSYLESQITWNL